MQLRTALYYSYTYDVIIILKSNIILYSLPVSPPPQVKISGCPPDKFKNPSASGSSGNLKPGVNQVIKKYCSLLTQCINPLNTELNPIYHLLALLGAHHILHVSRVRVKVWKNFAILGVTSTKFSHLEDVGSSSLRNVGTVLLFYMIKKF